MESKAIYKLTKLEYRSVTMLLQYQHDPDPFCLMHMYLYSKSFQKSGESD